MEWQWYECIGPRIENHLILYPTRSMMVLLRCWCEICQVKIKLTECAWQFFYVSFVILNVKRPNKKTRETEIEFGIWWRKCIQREWERKTTTKERWGEKRKNACTYSVRHTHTISPITQATEDRKRISKSKISQFIDEQNESNVRLWDAPHRPYIEQRLWLHFNHSLFVSDRNTSRENEFRRNESLQFERKKKNIPKSAPICLLKTAFDASTWNSFHHQ